MAGSLMDVFVKIGADTSGLESGISKAKGLAGGLGNAISTGLKVAGAAIGAATTAVVGFAASSVEVGKTFDASMSQVAATMGVSKAEIADLEAFAKEMGRTTAFSATQAAEALNYMALAGYDADTSMEMLPNVLNLAAAGNMDLARASDMVTDAQTALGLSLKETTELVDMMALTSSKTNTSVTQLGDAILTIGGTAKNLAGGTTELNQMLGVLADNGIKGAEGGTHLRNAILSLSAPTDNAAAALKSLGVETADAEGNLRSLPDIMGDLDVALDGLGTAEKANIISTIFNKTDIAAVNALLDTSRERYDELETEINGAWIASKNFENGFKGTSLQKMQERLVAAGVSADDFNKLLKKSGGDAGAFVEELSAISGLEVNDVLSTMGTNLRMLQTEFEHVEGSAQQMAQTQLDNLAGDITLWNSALEGAQLLISGALAPELREFVKFGTEGLSKISDAFEKDGLTGAMEAFKGVLSDGIAMVTEKVPDFINAGKELLSALGQGIMDNLPAITDVAINIGFDIVDAFISAIPALMDGGAKIISQLGDALIANAPELISKMVDVAKYVMTSFASNLSGAAEGATALLKAIGEGLSSGKDELKGAFTLLISSIQGMILEDTQPLLEAGLEIITILAQGILENIPYIFDTLTMLFTQIVAFMGEHATEIANGAAELVKTLAMGLADNLPAIIEGITQLVIAIATALTDPGTLTPLIEGAVAIILAIAQGLIVALPQLIEAIPVIVENLVTALIENLPLVIDGAIQLIVAIVQALIENAPLLVAAAIQIVNALVQGLIESLPALLTAGMNLISSLLEMIISNFPKFVSNGMEIVKAIIEGIVGMLGSIIKAAIELVTRFIRGVVDSRAKIINAGKDMIKAVKDGIMQKIEEAKTWGKDLIANFIGGIKEKWDALKDTVAEVAGSIREFLGFSEPSKGPLANFHTYAPDMMQLFAKGIRDNEHLVTDQIEKSFDFMNKSALLPSMNNTDINSSNSEIIRLLQEIAYNGRVEVILQDDADAMFRVMQRKSRTNRQITGQPSFA